MEEFGADEEVVSSALLVAGEAVANAVGHGNGLDPAKSVRVTCWLEDGEIGMGVEDEGTGISEDRLQQAALPDDPMDTHGRGLYIMKSLADRVWLEQEGRKICAAWTHPSPRGR